MQQLAYSGYQAPQQIPQIPQITMEPTTFFADSVIPMIPGWEHSQWMVVRDDFRVVAGGQVGAVEVLRFFERMTNRRKAKLRKEHGIPEGYLPHDDDLRISMSFDDIWEGAMYLWSKVACWRAVYYLIELGFLEQSFIARKTAAVVGQPKTVIYEDDKGFFIAVDDKDGNYTDINGAEHNAADEGYIIEWQYLLRFDAIRAALAKAAWQDPPEPVKRWPSVVKRREPVPSKKGNDATAPTDCDPSNASSVSHQPNPSHPSAQGGTLNAEVCEEESGPFYNTVDTNVLSTIRQDILTNVPINPTNSNVVEDFCKAPWSAETLIGLARLRCRPGLFEVTGDDTDYAGAEKLDRLRLSLGLDPTMFWPLVDQHIMAMMDGPTWYAKRQGKKLDFTLDHVARNWQTVEAELKKEPWSPLDPVPYFGPPLDTEEIPVYPAGYSEPEPVLEPEPTPIRASGMLRSYAERLLSRIYEQHQSLSARLESRAPHKYVICIEYAPGQWIDIASPREWDSPSEQTRRLIELAVEASQPAYVKEGEKNDACFADAGKQLANDQTRNDHRGARGLDNRDVSPMSRDQLRL